ncbi:MAG: histidine phosphatase family protein [Gibbsiella quercinecans]|uniref:histidine phosphatase family protein n=1 Tax=Gibbsiella quercinecans TaxID=929813 RepID=UPI003F3BB754
MPTLLTLICQGETAAARRSRFPLDEPLTAQVQQQIQHLPRAPAAYQAVWCAPQLAARQTAQALGLHANVDEALRDSDYGAWAGLPLMQVMAEDSHHFAAWLAGGAPPGGESAGQLIARCDRWLAQRMNAGGRHCAVVSAAVIRAIAVGLLGAPVQALARLDIHPLSISELSSDGRRWQLCQLGRRVD